jgi:hypothetical protein
MASIARSATGPAAGVLPGLIGFTHALRAAGLGVDAHQVDAYLRSVGGLDLADPVNLYWAGRLTLCAAADDLPYYDEAFAAWFSPDRQPGQQKTHQRTTRPKAVALTAVAGNPSTEDETTVAPLVRVAASDTEVLRHKDFTALSPSERALLREMFTRLRIDPPRRRALRYRPARHGRRDPLDPRRTLRAALATGGEVVELRRRRRERRPRKVVLLIDVSGSMSPYADPLLRFAHIVTRRLGVRAEVFTIGTRLTRVSRQLRQRDPDQALALAARAVPDFAGGTRLGEGLRAFLDRWGQRGAARQAVVVVCSDGWERGDPRLLGEQVARLRRLAHAVLWANPHAGAADYRPVQSGIAVALPHLSALVAGHSLDAMENLLREIRDA